MKYDFGALSRFSMLRKDIESKQISCVWIWCWICVVRFSKCKLYGGRKKFCTGNMPKNTNNIHDCARRKNVLAYIGMCQSRQHIKWLWHFFSFLWQSRHSWTLSFLTFLLLLKHASQKRHLYNVILPSGKWLHKL